MGPLAVKVLTKSRGDYRLAVVVSKKVHKSAVTRNRIRRRLYECVRLMKQEDPSAWPHDIVLTCFDESIAHSSADKLRVDVEKLFKKAKITTA